MPENFRSENDTGGQICLSRRHEPPVTEVKIPSRKKENPQVQLHAAQKLFIHDIEIYIEPKGIRRHLGPGDGTRVSLARNTPALETKVRSQGFSPYPELPLPSHSPTPASSASEIHSDAPLIPRPTSPSASPTSPYTPYLPGFPSPSDPRLLPLPHSSPTDHQPLHPQLRRIENLDHQHRAPIPNSQTAGT
ncbi:hypothetical protein R3P38DRAFT_3241813 [Favolaschia claudopus]|uniref:Uncharacterized protein n=1 Tax=Favolaschia claudopus TaxID=2862362 RepID=A0AAV9Z5N3_9AGAR